MLQLRKRLQELHEDLENRVPELIEEIRVVERYIKAKESESDNTYASFQVPYDAVLMCLDINGDFKLTKKEIKKILLDGGYGADKPKLSGGLINDSINNAIRKGNLVLKNELVGRPKRK